MNLVKKGTLIAGCLATFQIVLLVALAIPQAEIMKAEEAAEYSAHLGNAISRLMINAMSVCSVAFKGKPVSQSSLDETKASRQDLDKLKGRLPAESLHLVEEIENTQQRLMELTHNAQQLMANGAYTGAAQFAMKREFRNNGFILMDNAQKLMVMMSLEDRRIDEAIQRQHDSRYFSEVVLALALVIEGLLAVFVFCWMKLDIGKRIGIMMQNTSRLAERRALLPLTKGNDEIAELDRVFHHMSDVLSRSARERQAMVDYSRDAICRLDRGFSILTISPAAQKILGISPAELVGKKLDDLVAQEDRHSVVQYLESRKAGASMAPVEARLTNLGGSYVDTILSGRWSNSKSSYFCVIHDNTKRKMTERIRREVMQMVNHDVKTPLFTVSGFLEMVGENFFGVLTDQGVVAVKKAGTNTEQMLALVEDLLALEKMESGMDMPNIVDVPIGAIIEETLAANEDEIKERHIKLAKHVPNLSVSADQARLKKSMFTLVATLLGLTRDGEEMKLTAERQQDFVEISITTAGKMEDGLQLDAILNPYLDSGFSVRAKQCSRLSVAVARTAIEINGGSLKTVEEGGRLGFFIKLPTSNVSR